MALDDALATGQLVPFQVQVSETTALLSGSPEAICMQAKKQCAFQAFIPA